MEDRVLLLGGLRTALEGAGMVPPVLIVGDVNRFALRVASEGDAQRSWRGDKEIMRMAFQSGSGRPSEIHIRNLERKCYPDDPIFRIEWDCIFESDDMTYQFMPRIKGGPQDFEECMDSRDLNCLKSILLGRPAEPVELIVPSAIRRKGHRDDRVVSYPIGQLKLQSSSAQCVICLLSELKDDAFTLGLHAAQDL